MPMRLQLKLLRVLQENAIRPLGATDAVPVNVRVISATTATCSSCSPAASSARTCTTG